MEREQRLIGASELLHGLEFRVYAVFETSGRSRLKAELQTKSKSARDH